MFSLKQNLYSFSIICLVAATLMIGCKKDDRPAPSDASQPGLLREVKNNDEFIRFEYNSDGTVKTTITNALLDSGVTTSYQVFYHDNKTINRLETTNGKKLVAEYESGLLHRVHHYVNDERIGVASYHYENGLLKSIFYHQPISSTEMHPVFNLVYTYDEKNRMKESILLGLSETPGLLRRKGHITYEYDEKQNPLYKNKDLFLFFIQPVSSNNVINEGHYDAQLVLEERVQYSYQYNQFERPVKADIQTGLNAPYQTGSIRYQYQ